MSDIVTIRVNSPVIMPLAGTQPPAAGDIVLIGTNHLPLVVVRVDAKHRRCLLVPCGIDRTGPSTDAPAQRLKAQRYEVVDDGSGGALLGSPTGVFEALVRCACGQVWGEKALRCELCGHEMGKGE